MLNKYFYNLSLAIITFIFLIFVISNVGFVFHFSLQFYYVPLSFVLTLLLLFFINNNKKDYFIQSIILIILLLLSNFMSRIFRDYSFDGLAYHFQDMFLLKNGWNPVYTDAESFSRLMGLYSNHIWVQGWSKFCEIVSGNFYLITNQISAGQVINFLMAIASFMSVFCALDKLCGKKYLNYFFSLLLIVNPVVIGQMFTMYIDLHIYFAFLIIFSTIIQIEKSNVINKYDYFVLTIIFTIFMHVKFSAFFYSAIISFVYLGYLIFEKKYQNISKYITSVFLAFILTMALGVHPFYTNYEKYGHPFYPLFGKKKEDVIERQITTIELKNKTSIQKAIMSTFAVQTNIAGHIKYRFPFVIKQERLYEADMRLGGMGHFWSAIIIISLICVFGISFKRKEDRNIFVAIFIIILSSYLFYPDPWWMRYVPQIWIFPVLVLYLSLINDNRFFFDKDYLKKIFIVFMTLLLCSNSAIVAYENYKLTKDQQNEREKFYKMLANYEKGVLIYPAKNAKEGNSTIYSYLAEYNVNYKIAGDKEYIKNKSEYIKMEEFSVFPTTYWWKKIN